MPVVVPALAPAAAGRLGVILRIATPAVPVMPLLVIPARVKPVVIVGGVTLLVTTASLVIAHQAAHVIALTQTGLSAHRLVFRPEPGKTSATNRLGQSPIKQGPATAGASQDARDRSLGKI